MNSYDAAKAYFPSALEYVRGDRMEPAPQYEHMLHADQFDYDSIMIYSSYDGIPQMDQEDRTGPTILRKDTFNPVWMCGSDEPNDAKLSAGDIARIAQLYPLDNAAAEAARDEADWGMKRVTIRDAFVDWQFHVHGPTEIPVLIRR